jgi:hypothetical protein
VGVYASRSPFRPNPLGLSAVSLLSINCNNGKISLAVQGADLIDGTPILDIKPYIPYADSIPDATGGFAEDVPKPTLQVEFTDIARKKIVLYQNATPELETMIRETLCLDPRPAYRRGIEDSREYGMLLDRYNIRWKVQKKQLIIMEIFTANQ